MRNLRDHKKVPVTIQLNHTVLENMSNSMNCKERHGRNRPNVQKNKKKDSSRKEDGT